MRDRDNLVGDVQSSTIYVSVQDLHVFQFKRVHLLTKDKTIFIGAWFLKVKAIKHVQQGTQPNLTFAFSGNFDLSITMPNFIRVNRDKMQHLNHFIRNDCIPLHDGPKERS